MSQSNESSHEHSISSLQKGYRATVDRLILDTTSITRKKNGSIYEYEIKVRLDPTLDDEELRKLVMDYYYWLNWGYAQTIKNGSLLSHSMQRCGMTSFYLQGSSRIFRSLFEFFIDHDSMGPMSIFHCDTNASFKLNTENYSHIKYFIDQIHMKIQELEVG